MIDATPPTFIFVSGCMRTGTTFVSKWLGDALPQPMTALRESRVLVGSYQAMLGFELSARPHAMGYSLAASSPARAVAARGIRDCALALYETLGWQPGQRLLDKQPYTYSDLPAFLEHTRELFPAIKLVVTTREPVATVASMLNRTWGRRPLADGVAQPVSWSLPKCCLQWRLAIEGLASCVDELDILVLDYSLLSHGTKVQAAVARHLGCEVAAPPAFENRAKAVDPRRDEILTEVGMEAREKHQTLLLRSARQLGLEPPTPV